MTRCRILVYGCTDTGLVREVNEDHILVGRFIKNSGCMGLEFVEDDELIAAYGMLFAVADGIGGALAGEVASKLALTTIERHFYGFEKNLTNPEAFHDALQAACKRANYTVIQVGDSRPECRGMGCTITGVCLTPSGYVVFNSGDSRVYRFRSGILCQLTDDDTRVNELLKAGLISYDAAQISGFRHEITNGMGQADFALKTSSEPALRLDDRILICSDGLHDLVPVERMETIIARYSVDSAAKLLVEEAKARGGHDNISLILLAAVKQESIPDDNEIETESQFYAEPASLPINGSGEEDNNDQQI